MTEIAPYGSWTSPISAADVARGAVAVAFPAVAGDEVWWQESRPAEGGRVTIMAAGAGDTAPRELLPAPWYARNRVHEYGGQSFLPVPELGAASISSSRTSPTSGCTGRARPGGAPAPLTPDGAGFRFADLTLSPDGREIWCVRETSLPDDGQPQPGFHTGGGMKVSRAIVAVPLDGSAASDAAAIRVLVTGAQFFAFPTASPDGTKLAWINWDHPRMPWDGTELRTGAVTGGAVTVADSTLVMGGPGRVGARTALARRPGAVRGVGRLGLVEPVRGGRLAGGAPRPLHPARRNSPGRSGSSAGGRSSCCGDGRLAVLHGLGELRLAVLDPVSGELADVDLPGYRTAQRAARRLWRRRSSRGRRPAHPLVGAAGLPRRRGRDDQAAGGRRTRPRLPAGRAPGTAFRWPERARGPCPGLPSRQSGGGGAGGRTPAVHRACARRPDRELGAGAQPGEGVLHQPGHRGDRRELRRFHWVRAGVPGAAARRVGRGGRGRRDARGAGARGVGRRGPRQARHPGRFRGRLDGAGRGDQRAAGRVRGRCSPRRRRTSACRTCGRS